MTTDGLGTTISRHPSVAIASDHIITDEACNGEHLPSDFIYDHGNWVLRPSDGPEHSTPVLVEQTASPVTAPADGDFQSGRKRAASVSGIGSILGRGGSIRSYAKQQLENGGGSAFVNGAGTTGPGATPELDDGMQLRAASADASLTPKQKSKIVKEELKEGRQLTKVIRKESKIEKEALAVAIKELAEWQALQKAAVKAESKAHTAHTMSLTGLQKSERAFHIARTNYESAQAALLSLEEALETSRRNAREATQSLQDKMREVEALRTQKGVDEREREVKIVELIGRKSALKKWL